MGTTENYDVEALFRRMPDHLIIEKRLWVQNVYIDIEHIDNDVEKGLDYIKAFRQMEEKLEKIK